MTSQATPATPKEALEKLIKKACPQDRAGGEDTVIATAQQENDQEPFNKITIEIGNNITLDTDDRELILRRIRRALMASTLTSLQEEASSNSSNKVEIEFSNHRISLTNPLNIEIKPKIDNTSSPRMSNHALYFKATNSSGNPQLSDELLPIIGKKIDVLMEEYKTLRSEILQHLQALHTIMNFSLAALVIGFTAIYNLYPKDASTAPTEMYALFSLLLLFVVPGTGFLMNSLWLIEAGDIGRIGYFLSRTEVEINSYFDRFGIFNEYELDVDYETSLRRIRKKYDISGISSQGFQSYMVTLFFVMIELLSIIVALWIIFNKLNLSKGVCVFILIIFLVIYFILLHRYRLKRIWLNEKWYKALNLSRDDVLYLTICPQSFLSNLQQNISAFISHLKKPHQQS